MSSLACRRKQGKPGHDGSQLACALAIFGCLLSWKKVRLRVIICLSSKGGAEGMWLNNGQRFWEKESTFSCNGTRQSYFGELIAAVGAD